jgi:proteic killer suppression protein
MEVQYGDDHLKRLATDKTFNPKGISQELIRGYVRRIAQLKAMIDERGLRAIGSLHFEKLDGRSGQHSIRINDQWRIILEFDESTTPKKVVVIGIEDYH